MPRAAQVFRTVTTHGTSDGFVASVSIGSTVPGGPGGAAATGSGGSAAGPGGTRSSSSGGAGAVTSAPGAPGGAAGLPFSPSSHHLPGTVRRRATVRAALPYSWRKGCFAEGLCGWLLRARAAARDAAVQRPPATPSAKPSLVASRRRSACALRPYRPQLPSLASSSVSPVLMVPQHTGASLTFPLHAQHAQHAPLPGTLPLAPLPSGHVPGLLVPPHDVLPGTLPYSQQPPLLYGQSHPQLPAAALGGGGDGGVAGSPELSEGSLLALARGPDAPDLGDMEDLEVW